MGTTNISGLPFPELSDQPDGPDAFEDLANALDPIVTPKYANATARDAANPSPSEGTHAYLNDINALTWYSGSAWEGTWKSYTPSWTSSAAGPTIGNGTLVGRYLYRPQLVIAEVRLVFGSTTGLAGTGVWFFSLPITASAATVGGGSCFYLDTGTQDYAGVIKMESTTTFRCMVALGASGSVQFNNPFNWGNTDELRAQITYSPA